VKLEGKLCSRKHATIAYDGGRGHVYLMDLGSAHGTFIDKIRVEKNSKTRLRKDQEIWFGIQEGEPRYSVHAVPAKKRRRDEEAVPRSTKKGDLDVQELDDEIKSASRALAENHSKAQHAHDGSLPRSTPFWSGDGARGGAAADGGKDDAAKRATGREEHASEGQLAAQAKEAACCHVLLRHSASKPPNPNLRPEGLSQRLPACLPRWGFGFRVSGFWFRVSSLSACVFASECARVVLG
jgi:pSer/pThr/pTyr-binding forkhead associated (FHA) protein